MQKTIEELRQTETELDDVREQIGASRDVLERIDMRAPDRGIVVRVNYHSHGAVVAPGAIILELLPVDDKLVIEGRVNPNDISHVKDGQDALVRLTALNQRLTPGHQRQSGLRVGRRDRRPAAAGQATWSPSTTSRTSCA